MNITVKCDRCGNSVEGMVLEDWGTAGFYDMRDSSWSRFKKSQEEKFVCDECMWTDPLYWVGR
jgi:hypothetical protein